MRTTKTENLWEKSFIFFVQNIFLLILVWNMTRFNETHPKKANKKRKRKNMICLTTHTHTKRQQNRWPNYLYTEKKKKKKPYETQTPKPNNIK